MSIQSRITRGIGFGALAVASLGFVSSSVLEINATVGTATASGYSANIAVPSIVSGNFLLLALMPVFMQDTTTPRKPFPAREVIPRRLVGKVDKLRDDDALFVVLLM